ncbi:MAG TPA: terminase [Actinomycetes bacterium]|nr:terminase [Actinomycetes bacterium]
MPWQQHVADVALEQDPDTRLLVYRRVVLTVPRQSGKTTLLLAKMVHRAQGFGRRQRITYTAQNRLKARQKWEDEHLPILERSPFRPLYSVRRQIGQEAIRWHNGSIHNLDAPTEEAGHGDVLDEGVIDEAFAQEDARVEQAMAPAMITRPQPQLSVVSTAGKSKLRSPYLWGKIEAGRAAVEAGISTGVAYFEWSAPPESDPGDPATWWGCMPALGHTVTEAAVAAEFQDMDLSEFRRAYLNQWLDEAPDEWLVITRAQWEALTGPATERTAPVAFAADMTPDMSYGSIGVAWRNADGSLHVEIPQGDHRPGTSWMADRLIELYQTWRPCAVVVAADGPASSLVAPLQAALPKGVLLKPGATERAAATGQFYEAVTDSKTLRHIDQPELANALASARKQTVGDHWWWARKGIFADVSPLVAVTYAAWGHAMRGHLRPPRPMLVVSNPNR